MVHESDGHSRWYGLDSMHSMRWQQKGSNGNGLQPGPWEILDSDPAPLTGEVRYHSGLMVRPFYPSNEAEPPDCQLQMKANKPHTLLPQPALTAGDRILLGATAFKGTAAADCPLFRQTHGKRFSLLLASL